jgi:phosphoglycolate phosphatase
VRPQALLIDLDGTLVDTLPDFVAALEAVALDLALLPPSADWVRGHIGRGSERLVRDWLDSQQRGEQLPNALPLALALALPLYAQHYARVNGRAARPFDGALAMLNSLRAMGLRLACVTNKPQAMAEALLLQYELRQPFELVVGAAPGLRAKPHPDAMLAACAAMQLSPSCTWMLGDSRNDAEAALAAGCSATLLLRHGYNHGEPIDAVPARAHLDRLADVPPCLLRLISGATP